MSIPSEPTRDRQLVALAKAVEVLGARRRRLLRELRELDLERKRVRKLLDDMLQPSLPSVTERGAVPGVPTSTGEGVEGTPRC